MFQKHILKSKPIRNNLTDEEFNTRVHIWDKYISSSLKNSNFEFKQKSDKIHISGKSINNNDFSFDIPISQDIKTKSGISKNCELIRISLSVFPWSDEKLRVLYDTTDLPEGKEDSDFATSEKTDIKILIIYDLQSDKKINTCLLLNRTNFADKTSKYSIPLLEKQ